MRAGTARSVLAAAIIAACVFGAAAVRAQSPVSETAAARELYAQGVEAAQEGRLAEAIARFERSYALAPRDATLLNLAQVQERDGRVVAAIDSYRRFLARAEPEMQERHGDRAREAIATLSPRVARLEVVVFGAAASDEILLDGAPLTRASLGLDLPVDPGRHELSVRRGETTCGARSTELAPGGRGSLELRVFCAAQVSTTGSSSPTETAGTDPTPFIGLGIALGALVAGGIVLGVVLSTPPPAAPDPFVGNVGMGAWVIP